MQERGTNWWYVDIQESLSINGSNIGLKYPRECCAVKIVGIDEVIGGLSTLEAFEREVPVEEQTVSIFASEYIGVNTTLHRQNPILPTSSVEIEEKYVLPHDMAFLRLVVKELSHAGGLAGRDGSNLSSRERLLSSPHFKAYMDNPQKFFLISSVADRYALKKSERGHTRQKQAPGVAPQLRMPLLAHMTMKTPAGRLRRGFGRGPILVAFLFCSVLSSTVFWNDTA